MASDDRAVLSRDSAVARRGDYRRQPLVTVFVCGGTAVSPGATCTARRRAAFAACCDGSLLRATARSLLVSSAHAVFLIPSPHGSSSTFRHCETTPSDWHACGRVLE